MEIIRSNPHIFQIAVSDFDSGTSSAYAASSAIISPIKPSIVKFKALTYGKKAK